jgi:putative restriction endonuclease
LKFYVGVTDNSWFNFLTALRPDEVNFWQPGGSSTFRALSPGELFLFKLHAPLNFIVGGGFFVKHSLVPLSLAWEAFGKKNGTEDLKAFRDKVLRYRGRSARVDPDPTIGCIILTQPFFLDRAAWLPAPEDWKPNIVQGRTYSTETTVGAHLLAQISERLSETGDYWSKPRFTGDMDGDRYGKEYLTHARLGQGAFRVLVTDAYGRRCAMTGEKTLPVLESATSSHTLFQVPTM